jgi:hypothetical protein
MTPAQEMDHLEELLRANDCRVERNDVAWLIETLGDPDCTEVRNLFRKMLDDEWNKQRNVRDAETARKNAGKSAVDVHREFVEVTKRVAG